MIPFFDLKRQYENLKSEISAVQQEVFNAGNFIHGHQVALFEKTYAEYIGVNHCISCGNATDALELVLRAWNIGPGNEVIVPAFTWFSDAEVVRSVGAVPVFVDIEAEFYGIAPEKIEEKITRDTRAIIAVHLFGHPCNIGPIAEIAERYNLLILEDAAQAHGASLRGRKTGSFGNAGIFSFYPTKNLGAYGDGGAVTTNDDVLASKVRMLANHGQKERDYFVLSGMNSRLDELQAAYLNVKLKYFDAWNKRRAEFAESYSEKITDAYIKPSVAKDAKHVYHQYVIRTGRRDEVKDLLNNSQIGFAIHYPKPIPATTPFHEKEWRQKYPVSAEVSQTIISLPIFPELTKLEIQKIISVLNELN